MKNGKITSLCLLLFLLLSVLIGYSEEGSEATEDRFMPKTEPGTMFEGSISSTGSMKCAMTFRMKVPNGLDWNYGIDAKYRQQVLDSDDFGQPNSSVRFYNSVKYTGKRAKMKMEPGPDLEGRKYYTKVSPVVMNPIAPNKEGLAILNCDLTDPFIEMLPPSSLRSDLEWDPDLEAVNRVFYRMSQLQPTYDPEPKKADTPPNNDKKDEGEKAPDEVAEAPFDGLPDVMLERGGGGRGGWGRDFYMPPETTKIVSVKAGEAKARIVDFSIESFTVEVDVLGEYQFPKWARAGDEVFIPFKGSMKFTYDLTSKTLSYGYMKINGDCKENMDSGGSKLNVDIKWDQELTIKRDKFKKTTLGKELKHACRFFASPGDKSQMVVAMANNGMVNLFANWDGTYCFEVLNNATPLAKMQDLPSAGVISACGKYMLFSDGKDLVYSQDFGESFKPVTIKCAQIVDMFPLNTPEPQAIAKTADGSYVKIDISNDKLKFKKVPSPAGGKDLQCVIPASNYSELILIAEDFFFIDNFVDKKKKLKSIPPKVPECFCATDDGAILFCDGKFGQLTKDGYTELSISGSASKPRKMFTSDKRLFVLDEAFNLNSVDIAGGTLGNNQQEIKDILMKFKSLFKATPNGLVI